jgi:hypothetical protein
MKKLQKKSKEGRKGERCVEAREDSGTVEGLKIKLQ